MTNELEEEGTPQGILFSTMPKLKEGDRVRVVKREVSAEDRRSNRYFEHMAGLTGTVSNVYGPEEIAIQVELDSTSKVQQEVHKEAERRLREKFMEKVSQEAKATLTAEELNFGAHFMILARESDLEKL